MNALKNSLRTLVALITLLVCLSSIQGCSDRSEDIDELRTLAEQGDAAAQSNLGVSYAKGLGVPQDYAEAMKWFRKAAEQGNAPAQYNLGGSYKNGLGVPQDYKEAVKWYRKAAEQGFSQAQYNLGVSYAMGTGVPQDDVLAYIWLNLAGASGIKDATEAREAISETMTPEQIAEAQKLSREWKPKGQ